MAGPGMCCFGGSNERCCLRVQALTGRPRQAVA